MVWLGTVINGKTQLPASQVDSEPCTTSGQHVRAVMIKTYRSRQATVVVFIVHVVVVVTVVSSSSSSGGSSSNTQYMYVVAAAVVVLE